MASLTEILHSLPRLDASELREVIERANQVMVFTGATPVNTVEDRSELGLYDAAASVMTARGHAVVPAIVLLRSSWWRGVKPKVEAAEAWINEAFEPVNQVERMRASCVALEALAAYITPTTPLSWRSLFQNVDKVSTAVQQSFPGYAGSKLLRPFVIQHKPHVRQQPGSAED